MTTVASLDVLIGANISGLQRGLNQASKDVNNLGNTLSSKFKSAGESVSSLGSSLMGLSVPLAGGLGYGVYVASQFESSMAEISARTGLVGEDLQAISDYALQMGADTSFSAQQAADAFLQLLTSGSSVEESFALLPEILNAAAASGEDLGVTADTITDIMASFGLEANKLSPQMQTLATQVGLTDAELIAWGNNMTEATPAMAAFRQATGLTYDEMYKLFIATEDASDVVNILAQAAGASSASMADLGQGFANVGGVANAFGLSVQDTAAVLAIFSENGIKGAEAGTQLKSMLLNMSSDTAKTKAAWDELGVSMYDAQGNMRPLEQIISDLDIALDALPMERQNELMKQLGGSYGILGLNALRGSISIDEMRQRMSESAGAGEVAAARMDTFAGRMDALGGSVETLMITAMTPFLENVLKPMAEKATEVINSITEWAGKNPQLASGLIAIMAVIAVAGPGLMLFGGIISGVGAVIGILTSGFGLASTAVGLLTGATGGLSIAMGILFSPITLIVGAIGGLLLLLGSGEGGIIGALNTASTAATQLAQIGLALLVGGLNAAATAATQLIGIVGALIGKVGEALASLGNLQLGYGIQYEGVITPNTNGLNPDAFVPDPAAVNAALSGGSGFNTGTSLVPNDGFYRLHGGEGIVTKGRMRDSVMGGGQTIIKNYYVSSYGQSPRELLEMLKREEAAGSR